MRTSPIRILVALCVLAATLVAADANAERASRPVADGRARPALWLVEDADTRIYLFGTIHALRPDLYWFTGPLRDAFRDSDELVLEVAIPKPAEKKAIFEKLIARASRKDVAPMVERLPAEKRDGYRRTLKQLRLAPDVFDEVPPWIAGMTLASLPLVKAGFDPERGVDHVLALVAADSSTPVIGLETIEQQFGFLHDLPEEAQVQFLVAAMDDAERIVPQIDSVIDDWAAGDAEALAARLNEGIETSPELWKVLLQDRNRRWAGWIAARMREPGTVLVAVGAGHLAGRGSLQDELSRHELKVKRVDR